ncbi:hypothetical protein [Limnoglobus roseus]|uniref:J domain-containing protein n=1 Tax=Limnoglobus roseus TaxID=2598579 RepID=A0A5C1AHA0_9BACT|nr:hypothetical protein [Limnoglobus roseus]QEL18005.1 hypothetical protein PX52LOC_05019 [Limnoglobus roseus]
MTPPDLPDDPREWPKDPFALLGVERGAEDITIRRAYTQLIRRFKPEHHPEQFCKIREAYETCQQQAGWFRSAPREVPTEDDKADAALPRWSTPVVDVQPSAADKFWATATAGQLDEAYRGLVSLSLNENDSADVALRLYWLLAVDPKLDMKRTRHDWLFGALTQSKLDRPAVELYRRELEADAQIALADPYVELLNADAEWPQLLEVAQLRLAAAGRLGRYSLIEFDLKQLKKHVGLENDAAWLGLLVAAMDWAAWNQPNLIVSFCQDELQSLKHLELHHSYYFDRVDQTLYWGGEGSAVQGPLLEEFIRLLGTVWATHGPVLRSDIVEGLKPLAAQPLRCLGCLDDLFADRGPNLGILAVGLLGRYVPDSEHTFSADVLRGYARRVPGIGTQPWHILRGRLLDVFIQHNIRPEELAEACAADPEPRFREVSGAILADLSLRLAWLASCLGPVKTEA